MSKTSSGSTEAALRYAGALLDLAAARGTLESVDTNMHAILDAFAGSSDLRFLACSPRLGRARRRAGILAVADHAGFDPLVRNFLGVLAENGRLGDLDTIARAVLAESARRRGEVGAEILTAFALSDDQKESIRVALGTATGADVRLKIQIDPALIGGIVVRIGSHMVDDSVQRRLERLRRILRRAA